MSGHSFFTPMMLSCALSLVFNPSVAADINSLQQQLDVLDGKIQQMPNGDVDAARAYIQELIRIADQLKTMNNQDDAWKRAATQYNSLNQLAAKKAKTPPADNASQPIEPVVAEALAVVANMENLLQQMPAGDVAKANDYLSQLKNLIPKINAAHNKHHPKWAELRARYNEVNQKIVARGNEQPAAQDLPASASVTPAEIATTGLLSYEVAKFKRFKRDIDSSMQTLNELAPAKLTDPASIESWRSRVARHVQDVASFANPERAPISQLQQLAGQAQSLLEAKIQQAEQATASFGDVRQRVGVIEQNMNQYKVPQALRSPVSIAAIDQYVKEADAVNRHVSEDMAYLQQITGKTELVNKDTLSRLTFWIGKKPADMQQSLAQSTEAIDRWVEMYTGRLPFLNASDEEGLARVKQILLEEGGFDKTTAELQEALQSVSTANAFDIATKRPNGPDRKQQAADIEATIKHLQSLHASALENATMPAAQSTDPELLAAAKEAMAKLKPANPIVRMVINHGKTHKTYLESSVSDNHIYTYKYDFDQFQVVTAEQVGDKYYLYYTALKYFTSGGSTTPLNRWIISDRFQSSEILSENINK